MIEIKVGEKVTMKKRHPCGSFDWEILRVGQDVRLRCEGCGRLVMLDRRELEKRLKGRLR